MLEKQVGVVARKGRLEIVSDDRGQNPRVVVIPEDGSGPINLPCTSIRIRHSSLDFVFATLETIPHRVDVSGYDAVGNCYSIQGEGGSGDIAPIMGASVDVLDENKHRIRVRGSRWRYKPDLCGPQVDLMREATHDRRA